jgi:nucleotide-binding universal stress UspA family protein
MDAKTKTPNEFPVRSALVAIDFSAPSRAALAFAIPLLAKYQAELHLVHVFPVDYPAASLAALPAVLPEIEIERRVHARLRDLAAEHAVAVSSGNIHAIRGTPHKEICRLAHELKVDLIVTATRGQTGLKHLALGSTAERVVRHSPCPVMIIHSLDQLRPHDTGFERILAPVDFSDCGKAGLAAAKAVARRFGSRLVLLHSVDLHYYCTNPEFLLYDLPPLLEAAEKAAGAQLQELAGIVRRDGVATEIILGSGHPGAQICQEAKEHGCDLIVTATHGRTGLPHILVGSTAEYVVRHAPCPVIVVPSRDRPPA